MDRIRKTVAKIGWYNTNGYKVKLPKEVETLLAQEGEIRDEIIEKAVISSFKEEEYQVFSEDLGIQWKKESEDFMKKLATLARPLQTSYKVFLTKYGVGGSYNFPDVITLNITYSTDVNRTFSIIKHEIIHLTIQDLIEKYKIKHWVKERIVDLVFSKFFQDKGHIQGQENVMREVSDIFELYFPDIERIIVEIGRLEKYVDKR